MQHSFESHSQSAFSANHVLTNLALGGAILGATIIAAPHVLPAIGIGDAATAQRSMAMLHGYPGFEGSGIAGFASRMLESVPWIGEKLAAGGVFNAAATAVTGIGGVLLGNTLEEKGFTWGKAIRYAALATSALIALPTVLTALGAGVIFLSTFAGNYDFSMNTISFVDQTLGSMSGTGSTALAATSGIFAAIPHFLTCGMSVMPAALHLKLAREKDDLPRTRIPAHVAKEAYTDGSITVSIETQKPTAPYHIVNAKLKLRNSLTGEPITQDQLDIVHTEKLHLLITDSSLKDYYHLHPTPGEEPGSFNFSFSPRTANHYVAWADFTLIKNGRNHRIKTDIPCASNRRIQPSIRSNSIAESEGLHVELQAAEPLQQGRATIVTAHISDTQGRPVADLEPVMGAFAHLVGFSADGASLIHTHPMGMEPKNDNEHGGPKLRFHIEPDCTGPTQFYLQVKRQGQHIFLPFGQWIKPPALFSERVSPVHAAGHAH